jgi:hypothetical protein
LGPEVPEPESKSLFKAKRIGISYRQIVASGPKTFWLGFITNTPWKGRPLEIQLEFLRRTASSSGICIAERKAKRLCKLCVRIWSLFG